MKRLEFHDTEELSHALQHTDVSAMQISKGRFHGELAQYGLDGWSVQYVRFNEGRAACRGSSPKDLYAFVVPLSLSADFRLLGQEVTQKSFGFYAPRSEHGDTTGAGASEAVLIPPAGVIDDFEHGMGLRLPRAGSVHREAPVPTLNALRGVLEEMRSLASVDGGILAETAIARRLTERLKEEVCALLPHVEQHGVRGRPQLPRSTIIQQLSKRLNAISDEPLYASDLCEEFGISFPTLRRIFIEWYGVSPARYLLLNRFYLARRLLKTSDCESVTSVAHDCGFWDLSRFSMQYRMLFKELPSATLRNRAARTRRFD